jgi:hypothetical protein
MATMTAILPDEKASQTGGRPSDRESRRIRPGPEQKSVSGHNLFLSRSGANGSSPELGRGLANQGEATNRSETPSTRGAQGGATCDRVQPWRPSRLCREEPRAQRRGSREKGSRIRRQGSLFFTPDAASEESRGSALLICLAAEPKGGREGGRKMVKQPFDTLQPRSPNVIRRVHPFPVQSGGSEAHSGIFEFPGTRRCPEVPKGKPALPWTLTKERSRRFIRTPPGPI